MGGWGPIRWQRLPPVSPRLALRVVAAAVLLVWVAPALAVVTPAAVLSRNGLVATATVLARIPEALERLADEREAIAAERRAFDRFRERVAALEATAEPARTGPPAAGIAGGVRGEATGEGVRAVREAYRETVMATPHYESDYGERLAANMAVEFGPEVAAAVEEGGPLTPALKRALVAAAAGARERRGSLDRQLDGERTALRDARGELTAIDEERAAVLAGVDGGAGAEAVTDGYDRLAALEADCERLLDRRQRDLHGSEEPADCSLQEYLYEGAEWTYPVIGDALSCLDRVRRGKRRLAGLVSRLP